MKTWIALTGLVVLLVIAQLGYSQIDPVSVLLGRWEGWFEVTMQGVNPARNLIISSVEPVEDGRWKAKGRMGEPGAPKFFGVDIDVTREGEDIYLSWIYGGVTHTPIRVKLVGTDRLQGAHRPYKPSEIGGGQANFAVSFQRAPNKKKTPTP
jgi:hypothetical protein